MKVYNPTASNQNVVFKYQSQSFTLRPDTYQEVDDDTAISLLKQYPFLRDLNNPIYLPFNYSYELQKSKKRLLDWLRDFGRYAYGHLRG